MATNSEVGQPVLGPWHWAEPYQAAEAQLCPPCQAVSGAVSVSSPPVPSGFCRFSLPGSGNTHPSEMITRVRHFKTFQKVPWCPVLVKILYFYSTTVTVTRERWKPTTVEDRSCDEKNIRSVLYKLPCCLRTRTYHPQPCVHMPPGSPFDGL